MADDINSDVRDLGKYTVGQWIGFLKVQTAAAYATASAYVTRSLVGGAFLGYAAACGVGAGGYHEPVRDWAARHNFVSPAPQPTQTPPPAVAQPLQPITYNVNMAPVLAEIGKLSTKVDERLTSLAGVVSDNRKSMQGEITQLIADVPNKTTVATQTALQPALVALLKKQEQAKRQEQKAAEVKPIATPAPPPKPAPEPTLLEQAIGAINPK